MSLPFFRVAHSARAPIVHSASGRRGSNPRHQAWKACALPTELLPRENHFTFPPDYSRPILSRPTPIAALLFLHQAPLRGVLLVALEQIRSRCRRAIPVIHSTTDTWWGKDSNLRRR